MIPEYHPIQPVVARDPNMRWPRRREAWEYEDERPRLDPHPGWRTNVWLLDPPTVVERFEREFGLEGMYDWGFKMRPGAFVQAMRRVFDADVMRMRNDFSRQIIGAKHELSWEARAQASLSRSRARRGVVDSEHAYDSGTEAG